jgi:cell division protein ZapA (FtsZ GTPase activity inhibitor)
MTAYAQEPIELKVQGQKVSVRASGTDPELVREVVAIASNKLAEAEARAKGSSVAPHQLALIALLEVTEEYVKARGRFLDYQAELEQRIDSIAAQLPSSDSV